MSGQVNEFIMPSMGEGIEEATLVKWLKKPGDMVQEDEPLLEVSTDKVDTEISSSESGTLLEVFASSGDVIAVNSVIAHIGEAGATAAPKEAPKPTATTQNLPTQSPLSVPVVSASARAVVNSGDTKSSPLVRKIAAEHSIDLSGVAGSGTHGRITKRDIISHMENPSPAAPVVAAPAQAAKGAAPTAAASDASLQSLKTRTTDGIETVDGVVVKRETMTKMRTQIAEHMIRSIRTSPHVTTVFEVDMHKVFKIRESEKNGFFARENFKLTYTPFLIHAAVKAIKAHPIVNTSVDGNDILWKKDINMGCAVALDGGLIVPVIKNADELTLMGIARRLSELVFKARNKKLAVSDVQGGTFTVTNPGGFGSIVSAPIINQPQVAILGIGAIVKRPVVVDDMIAIRPIMQISLTFDHRVIDGEAGAKFLATMKQELENYVDLPN